ncbi:MAG: (Fe-S)-binding protein [Thermodesulfobacteriota bacterium]
MLLTGYSKEIFRPECNPSFQSVHCIAHLDQDIGEVLPYLNASLGGYEFIKDPPSVTFRAHGKLITVHAREIAINALKDEEEADSILQWLKQEINAAWEDRDSITPRFEGQPRPQPIEILKRLPKTNCRKCGEPTCLVFAVVLCEGGKSPEDCPDLEEESRASIEQYLSPFGLDDY